jgi:hypothetical protein
LSFKTPARTRHQANYLFAGVLDHILIEIRALTRISIHIDDSVEYDSEVGVGNGRPDKKCGYRRGSYQKFLHGTSHSYGSDRNRIFEPAHHNVK